MLLVFTKEETRKTPKVIINKEKGYIEMEGNSIPENVRAFYNEIVNELKNAILFWEDPNIDNLKFIIKLYYFNSSSAKFIYDLLALFISLHKKGKNISVEWYYEDDDIDEKEAGEELSEMLSFPFNFHEIKTDD
jgi:hypothetical protein